MRVRAEYSYLRTCTYFKMYSHRDLGYSPAFFLIPRET